MTYRVVFSPTARAGALHAFEWLAERSPDAAIRWYEGLEKAIASLSKYPKRHPVAEAESERFGIEIRQMLYGRRRNTYQLLFSIEGNTVHLLYVRHSAQGNLESGN